MHKQLWNFTNRLIKLPTKESDNMKILVDKLPKTSEECPYAIFNENQNGDKWISCGWNGTTVCCALPFEKECFFFCEKEEKFGKSILTKEQYFKWKE